MIRMLEVLDLAPDAQAGKSSGLVYSGPVVGLTMDRSWLYERINRRVDLMMAAGLEDEVRRLLAEGVPADAQSMSGIGYKEMIPAVRGECTPAEAAEEIRKTPAISRSGSLPGTGGCPISAGLNGPAASRRKYGIIR